MALMVVDKSREVKSYLEGAALICLIESLFPGTAFAVEMKHDALLDSPYSAGKGPMLNKIDRAGGSP